MKKWKWKALSMLAAAVTMLMIGRLDVSAAGVRDVFDAAYYANSYADLKAVYGTDEEALFQHYITAGINEGRVASPEFDIAAYRNGYPDLQAVFGDNWDAYADHYLSVGKAEGRTIGVRSGTEQQNNNTQAAAGGSIYDAMIAQKAVFPEGMRWDNNNFYAWHGGIYSGGYGCAGFAFALSDAAFGSAPARMHYDPGAVKVGDILRMNNDTHSVIVLEVNSDHVIIAEGNYNSSVHWGRRISKAELAASTNNVITRY